MVRGEVFHLPPPRAARGHEQRGARYAVVVQADEFLGLSTVLVSPTSTQALPASFRPTITLADKETRVLVEQTVVVMVLSLIVVVGAELGRRIAEHRFGIDEGAA